jgi:hypothetical protein
LKNMAVAVYGVCLLSWYKFLITFSFMVKR